ncbi:hypothetical protein JCM10213v2_007879 [Rhodosporidiobolus nylandii]
MPISEIEILPWPERWPLAWHAKRFVVTAVAAEAVVAVLYLSLRAVAADVPSMFPTLLSVLSHLLLYISSYLFFFRIPMPLRTEVWDRLARRSPFERAVEHMVRINNLRNTALTYSLRPARTRFEDGDRSAVGALAIGDVNLRSSPPVSAIEAVLLSREAVRGLLPSQVAFRREVAQLLPDLLSGRLAANLAYDLKFSRASLEDDLVLMAFLFIVIPAGITFPFAKSLGGVAVRMFRRILVFMVHTGEHKHLYDNLEVSPRQLLPRLAVLPPDDYTFAHLLLPAIEAAEAANALRPGGIKPAAFVRAVNAACSLVVKERAEQNYEQQLHLAILDAVILRKEEQLGRAPPRTSFLDRYERQLGLEALSL